MKLYKEFIIKTDPFIPDLLSGFLWDLNISGITEEDDSLIIFTNSKAELTSIQVKEKLQKLIDNNIISKFEVEEKFLEEKNWNEEWEKGVNIVEVSERIVIKPSFKEYNNEKNKIVITVDPKMSFGTGEHQTTKLVIQLLENYIKKGMRVLDVGTGTGVLAITAVKLGAESAVAIDNDEWCFENAVENFELNNVKGKVEIRLSEINQVEENNFDLVLANIQKNVLIDIADEIERKLSREGIIILSGLLIEDEKDIAERYGDFVLIEKKVMDEWIALVFKRK